jgi:hypothetical protein
LSQRSKVERKKLTADSPTHPPAAEKVKSEEVKKALAAVWIGAGLVPARCSR